MLNYNLVYKPHHGNNGEIFYLKPLVSIEWQNVKYYV